jgi:hypothetical protein
MKKEIIYAIVKFAAIIIVGFTIGRIIGELLINQIV